MTDDEPLTAAEADALAAPFRRLLPDEQTVRTLEQYRRREPSLTRPVGDHPPRRLPPLIVPTPAPSADDLRRAYEQNYNATRRNQQ